MAPAPQGTFWICAKVGDLDPDLRNMYPADNLADKIAAKMGAYDWGYLSFEEVADQLEKGWAEMVSHDTQGFLGPIEILLVPGAPQGSAGIERSVPEFGRPQL